jgi:hypothetical protein
MDPELVDKRVLERYVKEGRITRHQYEAYLRHLPDVSHLVDDTVSVRLLVPSQLREKRR